MSFKLLWICRHAGLWRSYYSSNAGRSIIDALPVDIKSFVLYLSPVDQAQTRSAGVWSRALGRERQYSGDARRVYWRQHSLEEGLSRLRSGVLDGRPMISLPPVARHR